MQWLFFLSAQRTYASHLVLIMSLTPLFVKFLRFALYREAVTMRVWAGSALAIGGAAVVLMPGKLSGDIILGDMLAAGAMVAFAIYTEGVNAYGRKQSSAAANLHVMGAGLLFLLIVAGWPQHQEESFSFRLDLPNVGELGGLLYLGICTTGIAYWGYTWSIRKLSAAVVTPFLYLQPAFGVLLAWIILEEHVKGWFLLGVFFILAGLHVVQRRTAER
jgi:drug/metabolite transporter (DMT)-like permease